MGANEDAVVTPGLKVRGLENLWIADASVMPHLVSGNINAACMMVGEKLARQFRTSKPWSHARTGSRTLVRDGSSVWFSSTRARCQPGHVLPTSRSDAAQTR